MYAQINSLPNEVLWHIFSFNPKQEQRLYELVCKRFCKALQEPFFFPELKLYKHQVATLKHKRFELNFLPDSHTAIRVNKIAEPVYWLMAAVSFSGTALFFSGILSGHDISICGELLCFPSLNSVTACLSASWIPIMAAVSIDKLAKCRNVIIKEIAGLEGKLGEFC